jgi:class 3 adenylate cyclase
MMQEQPNRVGRRLSAILAANVASYSRLMGLDEVGIARTLREHRAVTYAIVAKHGGRIVKTTGDGALVKFPIGGRCGRLCSVGTSGDGRANDGGPQDRPLL